MDRRILGREGPLRVSGRPLLLKLGFGGLEPDLFPDQIVLGQSLIQLRLHVLGEDGCDEAGFDHLQQCRADVFFREGHGLLLIVGSVVCTLDLFRDGLGLLGGLVGSIVLEVLLDILLKITWLQLAVEDKCFGND